MSISQPGNQRILHSLVLWPGGGAHLSSEFESDWHAHHDYQLTIPLGSSVLEAATSRTDELSECPGILLFSDQEHLLRIRGTALSLYLDPESPDGRRLRHLEADAAERKRRMQRVLRAASNIELFTADAVRDAAVEIWERLLSGLPRVEFDSRVERALIMIRQTNDLSLGDLAQEVNLSPSRLRHLFRDEVGLTIRTYSLWQRAQHALRVIAEGSSLSEAAYRTGFSDLSHLSRTHRRFWSTRVSDFQRSCLDGERCQAAFTPK